MKLAPVWPENTLLWIHETSLCHEFVVSFKRSNNFILCAFDHSIISIWSYPFSIQDLDRLISSLFTLWNDLYLSYFVKVCFIVKSKSVFNIDFRLHEQTCFLYSFLFTLLISVKFHFEVSRLTILLDIFIMWRNLHICLSLEFDLPM